MPKVYYWNENQSLMVPIEDIRLATMKENVLYSVKVKDYGPDWLGECKLKKWADCLSFSLVLLDQHGNVSEHSEVQTIVIRLAFLRELAQIEKPGQDIEELVAYLRAFPNFDAYRLSTLACHVAPRLYDVFYFNKLQWHDQKYGTFLRSFVPAFPTPDLSKYQNRYHLMAKEVSDRIASDNVTVMWALREFESRYGWTAIEILLDAERSWDDLLHDINRTVLL